MYGIYLKASVRGVGKNTFKFNTLLIYFFLSFLRILGDDGSHFPALVCVSGNFIPDRSTNQTNKTFRNNENKANFSSMLKRLIYFY